MFLQTGGGGKGIRPGQREHNTNNNNNSNNSSNNNHHQQQHLQHQQQNNQTSQQRQQQHQHHHQQQQPQQQLGHFRSTVEQSNVNNAVNIYIGQQQQPLQHTAHSLPPLPYHTQAHHHTQQQQQHQQQQKQQQQQQAHHQHFKPNQQTVLPAPPLSCQYFHQFPTTQTSSALTASPQTNSLTTSSLTPIDSVSNNSGNNVSNISESLPPFSANGALLPQVQTQYVTYLQLHPVPPLSQYNNGNNVGVPGHICNATQSGNALSQQTTAQQTVAIATAGNGPPHLHGQFFCNLQRPPAQPQSIAHAGHSSANMMTTTRGLLPHQSQYMNQMYLTNAPPPPSMPLLGPGVQQPPPPMLGPRAATAVANGAPPFLPSLCPHMPTLNAGNMGAPPQSLLTSTNINPAMSFALNSAISGTSLITTLSTSSNSELSCRELRPRPHAIPIINPITNENIFDEIKTSSADSDHIKSMKSHELEIKTDTIEFLEEDNNNNNTNAGDATSANGADKKLQRSESEFLQQVREELAKSSLDSDEVSTATPTPYSTADSALTSQTPSEASPAMTANKSNTISPAAAIVAEPEEEITLVLEENEFSSVTTTAVPSTNIATASVDAIPKLAEASESCRYTTVQLSKLMLNPTTDNTSANVSMNHNNDNMMEQIRGGQIFADMTIPPPSILCREPPPNVFMPPPPPPIATSAQHQQHQMQQYHINMNRRSGSIDMKGGTQAQGVAYKQDNRTSRRTASPMRRRDNRQQQQHQPQLHQQPQYRDNRSMSGTAIVSTAATATTTTQATATRSETNCNVPKHILNNPFKKQQNFTELTHINVATTANLGPLNRDIPLNRSVGNSRDVRPPYSSVAGSIVSSRSLSAQSTKTAVAMPPPAAPLQAAATAACSNNSTTVNRSRTDSRNSQVSSNSDAMSTPTHQSADHHNAFRRNSNSSSVSGATAATTATTTAVAGGSDSSDVAGQKKRKKQARKKKQARGNSGVNNEYDSSQSESAARNHSTHCSAASGGMCNKNTWTRNMENSIRSSSNDITPTPSNANMATSTTATAAVMPTASQSTNHQTDKNNIKINVNHHLSANNLSNKSNYAAAGGVAATTAWSNRQAPAPQGNSNKSAAASNSQQARAQPTSANSSNKSNNNNSKQSNLAGTGSNAMPSVVRILAKGEKIESEIFTETSKATTTKTTSGHATSPTMVEVKKQTAITTVSIAVTETKKQGTANSVAAVETVVENKKLTTTKITTHNVVSNPASVGETKKATTVLLTEVKKQPLIQEVPKKSSTLTTSVAANLKNNTKTTASNDVPKVTKAKAQVPITTAEDSTAMLKSSQKRTVTLVTDVIEVSEHVQTPALSAAKEDKDTAQKDMATAVSSDAAKADVCESLPTTQVKSVEPVSVDNDNSLELKLEVAANVDATIVNFSKPPPPLGNTTSTYAQLVAKNHAKFGGGGLCAPSSIVDPSKFKVNGRLRYPLEILKEMAKSTLSQKPPTVSCQKGDCISQLFVAPKYNANLPSMNLQTASLSPQPYQHMNFSESCDFITGKRGRSQTKQQQLQRHHDGNPMNANANLMNHDQQQRHRDRDRAERNASTGSSMGNMERSSANMSRKGDIIHVHLSLKEEIKLSECDNAWQPSTLLNRSSRSSPTGNDDLEAVLKIVRGVLNKLTPDNFDVLLKTVDKLGMNTQEKMQQVMLLIFEKTVSEPNFAPTYAKFCKTLFHDIKVENKSIFNSSMITRIQQEFENNVNDADAKRTKLQPLMDKLETCSDAKERAELQAELEDQEYQFRRRAWGTVRFIGEMYKLQSLTSERVFTCIESLLEHGSEEKLEYMCKLLTTVGHLLEVGTMMPLDQAKAHNVRMDRVFSRINEVVTRARKNAASKEAKISSRVRFMMQDLIELRARNWDQSASGLCTAGGIQTSSQANTLASQQHQDANSRHRQSKGGGGAAFNKQRDDKSSAVSHDDDKATSSRLGSYERNRSIFGNQQRSSGGAGNFFGSKGAGKKSNVHGKSADNEQSHLNFELSKICFYNSKCDEEGGTVQPTTKLGTSSLFQWRTAGRQSSQSNLINEQTAAASSPLAASKESGASSSSGSNSNATTPNSSGNKIRRQNANKFEVLEDATETSPQKQELIDDNDTDTDDDVAAAATGSANKQQQQIPSSATAAAVELTQKECQELLNRLVEELLDNETGWQQEAEATWFGINAEQQHSVLHHLLIAYLHLVQIKQSQRKACAKIFMHLMALPQFSKELVFQQAYARFAQEFPDMLWDVPNGWDYLFDFLGPLLHAKILNFADIWCADWVEHTKCTESFLKAMLQHFVTEFGQDYARNMWHRDFNLQRGQQFMPDEQQWQEFVNNNKLESLFEEAATAETATASAATTAEKLEHVKFLLSSDNNTQKALDFINSDVNINTSFIVSLTKFLCNDYATAQGDSSGNRSSPTAAVSKKQRRLKNTVTAANAADLLPLSRRQLNTDIFRNKCMPLLRRCLEEQVAHEYSCLMAVHDTLHQKHDTATAGELTSGIYSILYDTGVVSRNTFERYFNENAAQLAADETAQTAASQNKRASAAAKGSKTTGKNSKQQSPKHSSATNAAAAATTSANSNNSKAGTTMSFMQIFKEKLIGSKTTTAATATTPPPVENDGANEANKK